ncbi:MAG: hypothetical protein AAF614_10280 [Chloroflexota bacterium]
MEILIGQTPINKETTATNGRFVHLLGETYYKISHYDQMPPFFMSLVSSADHWLFISSTGGLTAGRTNAESALFPYETEDKIAAHHELTGSKTIIRLGRNNQINGSRRKRFHLWEPFSNRYAGLYQIDRHLYKNIDGNKLVFEEINHDLQVTIRVAWRTGDRFGFIRTVWLQNDGQACQIELLDGLQNLLPYGATTALQSIMSSLLDAYKRNELEPETGLGLFAMSATLTDRAEPSESLQTTVAWQVGLDNADYLLSSQQVNPFRNGRSINQEEDVRGKAGSYFVSSAFTLPAQQQKEWHIVADVNYDSAAVVELLQFLRGETPVLSSPAVAIITQALADDIDRGTTKLRSYVAAADGIQLSSQETTTAHHFANVLYNIMRGGIFNNGYELERADLLNFVQVRNRAILNGNADWFTTLPTQLTIQQLYDLAAQTGKADLIRLCHEYIPLTFSRRHGDPSRPWNQFSINLKKADGSPNLDYQGNWRDIFQNWEPLLFSFPAYTEGIIAKFLNATTADGYNPYRVTREGIEWEAPEPDNPWANIGYWSDHQIIYLQKLLEIAEQVRPGRLAELMNSPIFAYANVPYRLRPYKEMLADWYNTIDFDWERHEETETAVSEIGTDGRLVRDGSGSIVHVTMGEKLLVLLLAKLTNLVPEGGIWMNTQRPEWNDANNALVGKGLSVVTAGYLHRFIAFWRAQLAETSDDAVKVNAGLATLFAEVHQIFTTYQTHLQSGFSNETRQTIMNKLGAAATAYRTTLYDNGLSASQTTIQTETLGQFLTLAQRYIEQTLLANWRADGLAHTYNVLRLEEKGAAIDPLYPMLEGQVSMLSSGMLSSEQAVSLLHNLRQSDLYRPDQHSYMLYPNRSLAGFLKKNNVTAEQVADSALVKALTTAGDGRLLVQDVEGALHFNGRFRNAGDVETVLAELAQESAYADLVAAEQSQILDLFEATFNHSAFTGRSGTFFAYEGLGSIYWHMVSKLLLATQEAYQKALHEGADDAIIAALATIYFDVRAGIGFNKTPDVYGAFPTDPYSHTPMGSGARQPGMTGQVKEEVLTRWGELGLSVINGALRFAPTLLPAEEFLAGSETFSYVDVAGEEQSIALPANALAFTFCQTPIIYMQGDTAKIEVVLEDGRLPNSRLETTLGTTLDQETSQHILDRNGQVRLVRVMVKTID